MGIAAATKIGLALLASSLTCLTLCTYRVQTVHGWMMRHHCPFAKFAEHPPSRTIGSETQRSGESLIEP